MIRMLLASAVLAALSGAAAAQTDTLCQAEIEPLSGAAAFDGPAGAGYAVFGANAASQAVPVNILHRGESCAYALTVEGPTEAGLGQASFGPETLRFTLSDYPDGRPLVQSAPAPDRDAVRGVLPAAAQTDFTPVELYLSAPDGQVVAAGTYRADLRLRLYVDDGSGWALADETVMLAAFPVAPAIDLGFAAGGGGGDSQDLSILIDEDGGEARTTLYARSNAPFTARVESENDFRLERVDGLSDVGLGYALWLDGRSARGEALDFQRPSESETEIPVLVSVDSQWSTPPAGVYHDTVRIIVTAQ